MPDMFTPNKTSRKVPYSMAEYLKTTFPEVVDATIVESKQMTFTVEEVTCPVKVLMIDSSFLSIFDIKLIEGSMEFLIPESKKIAITREKSLQLFGNENPVGKLVDNGGKSETRDSDGNIIKTDDGIRTVCAVVTGFSGRSNYPFDFLECHKRIRDGWGYFSNKTHAVIELVSTVDVKTFEKKLYDHTVKKRFTTITKMDITPLTSIYYKDPNMERDVKFQHIIIFFVAGSLLIVCTLFNYLTLFVSRFRIRQREMALRVVCGASSRSLFALLSVEFILSLVIALLMGLLCIYTIIHPFLKLSGVVMELGSIYFELLIYIAGIIVISLLTFILTLAIFRYRTLNLTIRQSNKKIFRKTSIVVQLVISITFAFCTTIILKQMYHLHNTDLGFAFKNRGSIVQIHDDQQRIMADKMRQIPEITEVITGINPLLPVWSWGATVAYKPEDKNYEKGIQMVQVYVSEQYLKYYEIKLVEGEMLNDNDSHKYVLINESAAKVFGWHKAAEESFFLSNESYIVKGVIKNIYSASPTLSAQPTLYMRQTHEDGAILFKYNEGAWKTCKEKIEAIHKEVFPKHYLVMSSTEEEYDKFLKSENALITILTVVSSICVLICVFGFVSMVSLTCEERRKEIAIRKINGATIKDILDIFFKEHLTLLAVGALIAFPIGYLTMRRWLEEYVIQTEMSAWVYVAILLALIMAIVVCVGGKVYKTSRENPVNSISKL
jgi:ABC-type antimicrobial peptide transport system permease subunit